MGYQQSAPATPLALSLCPAAPSRQGAPPPAPKPPSTMGYDLGRAALNLQWTPRVARTEYVDNWEIVRHFTGKDPQTQPEAWREFYDAIHLDYLWTTHDGPISWEQRGRVTDMGHAVFVEDGSDYHLPTPSPFRDVEEVLAFDAVQEYGLVPDLNALTETYEHWYHRRQAECDQVISGGYYRTLISGAIAAFGWDLLLEAAGTDPEHFGERVLGSIFNVTKHHVQAWARTSIEV
ncbi:MAG TPA: hypothetical protein VHS06_07800, partial [Chloroflexota bacterium]|nr:hypothetical protein [Chloroflexota bacterium]